jgi:glucoamylase
LVRLITEFVTSAWSCAKSTAALLGKAISGPRRARYAAISALEEIAAVHGNLVPGDVRYNADGSLDVIRWNRPQYDGPALRALVAMRIEEDGLHIPAEAKGRLSELIHGDLNYTAKNAGHPCSDIWEEEFARHYYTLLVQLAAMEKGAARAKRGGIAGDAAFFSGKARDLRRALDASGPGLAVTAAACSVMPFTPGARPVILGVLHAGIDKGRIAFKTNGL